MVKIPNRIRKYVIYPSNTNPTDAMIKPKIIRPKNLPLMKYKPVFFCSAVLRPKVKNMQTKALLKDIPIISAANSSSSIISPPGQVVYPLDGGGISYNNSKKPVGSQLAPKL